jgi:sialidase-1
LKVRLYYTRGGAFSTRRLFGAESAPARDLVFKGNQELQPGANQFWISLELAKGASLDRRVSADCLELKFADGTKTKPDGTGQRQRIGVAVRTAGQDDCHTYRIPGLATTNKGTLIAVYDCRYKGSGDLPGDIDVGMSRSTDGGTTWEPRRVIMDMGRDKSWRFDGIGDPAVLVDRVTGAIWVAATWSHGNRSWRGSGPGLTPKETGQLMLARSDDDGKTWSRPINITRQVKDPRWRFVLQGPGKGITLRDGTLVFPAQYRSADDSPFAGKPFSTLIYSKDRGKTWKIGTGVKVDTTEAQLVELASGELMINCRDNRRGSRSVYTTRDLGRTWQVHPTSRTALPEPVCMASLIRVKHAQAGPLLLFSNPATRSGRFNMTLKVSSDEGTTWAANRHTLYDERKGSGYSCLTLVDEDHVGVLYEGRRELYFLRFPIAELVADR